MSLLLNELNELNAEWAYCCFYAQNLKLYQKSAVFGFDKGAKRAKSEKREIWKSCLLGATIDQIRLIMQRISKIGTKIGLFTHICPKTSRKVEKKKKSFFSLIPLNPIIPNFDLFPRSLHSGNLSQCFGVKQHLNFSFLSTSGPF